VGGALRHLPDAEKLRALSERDLLGQCS